jgi:hypothetical protein
LFFPDAPHPAAPPSPAPASEGIAFEAERKFVFICVHLWFSNFNWHRLFQRFDEIFHDGRQFLCGPVNDGQRLGGAAIRNRHRPG